MAFNKEQLLENAQGAGVFALLAGVLFFAASKDKPSFQQTLVKLGGGVALLAALAQLRYGFAG